MTGTKSQRIKAGPVNADGLADRLVGSSASTEAARQLIMKVAPSESTVLLLGESGTGKEVIARAVHECSTRSGGPFIPVNCGAIPSELLESELFGHEKGAFTGAINARKGRFEMAEAGTLFLDEIGDMPLEMQVKLLRVLQERSYERVGGTKTIKCNVRFVAATHQHLEQKVEVGSFRMDLFYRLNVFPIEIAPLCERADDIEDLIARFVKNFQAEQGISVRLMPDAIEHLKQLQWPGNVRELANLIERLTILHPNEDIYAADLPSKYQSQMLSVAPRPDAQGMSQTDGAPAAADLAGQSATRREGDAARVETEDLSELYGPLPVMSADDAFPYANAFSGADEEGALHVPQISLETPIDLKAHLVEVERALIMAALHKTQWVNAQAAKLLGLQRTTLVEKMRKYDIQRSDYHV